MPPLKKIPGKNLFNFDEVKKKFQDSTSTVEELRLAIFAPVQQFAHNSKTNIDMKKNKKIVRKTNWGEIKVEKTLLSQIHRDLLDCVISYGEQTKPLNDKKDTIAYRFSGGEILKKYSPSGNSRNTKWLEDKLTDMMSSVISVNPNNGDFFKFQILSSIGYKEELGAFYLEFHQDYTKFFAQNLTINYKENLPELLQVKDALIRAIIRLAFTQKNTLQMKVYDPSNEEGKTGILEAVGYPIESDSMRKQALKTLKDHKDVLKSFGVYYEPEARKNSIKYKKKMNIKFIPPALHSKLVSMGVKEEGSYVQLLDFVGKIFIYNNSRYEITNIELLDDKINVHTFEENDKNHKNRIFPFENKPSVAIQTLKSVLIEEDR